MTIAAEFTGPSSTTLDPLTLTRSMQDYRHLAGDHLTDLVDAFYQWQEQRRDSGLWPLDGPPEPVHGGAPLSTTTAAAGWPGSTSPPRTTCRCPATPLSKRRPCRRSTSTACTAQGLRPWSETPRCRWH